MHASSAKPIPEPEVSARVLESAQKLERHIRACGLKPGDRYITTEEAGKLLGKSVVIAQRAMALLAKRRILERRPKAGTFIGEAMASQVDITNLHFLLPEHSQTENDSREHYWAQIDGMRHVLGQVSAHFHFIPNQDLDYTRQIVERASSAGLLNGVILVLPSRQMRAFFNQSGIPTVVEGGVEPDLTNLCWIQWNQTQVGYHLASYLLGKGHRRLATIMRDVWSMGEPLLHEGINEALAQAGLFSNSLRMRSVPNEASAIIETVRDLLQSENPPTGFICRNEFQAGHVADAAASLGKLETIEITQCNAPTHLEHCRFTCAVPEISAFGFGERVGQLFATLLKNEIPEPRGYEIPVRLQPVNFL